MVFLCPKITFPQSYVQSMLNLIQKIAPYQNFQKKIAKHARHETWKKNNL